jgi:hypothetical protein
MRTRITLAAAVLGSLTLACGPRTPHREIPGMTLPVEAVHLDLQGLAARETGRKEPAIEHQPDSPPFMNGVPEHLRFSFDDDKLANSVVYRERQLLVYPLEAYRQIHEGDERAQFDRQVGALQKLIAGGGSGNTSELLVLPPVAAGQLCAAGIRHISFDGGAGLRWVTRYAVTNTPTTNDTIFYTFQGITTDGKYYVSFFWPVSAKDLPESKDFPASRRYLDSLAPADFTPDLSRLDALVSSISIKGN